MSSRPTEKPCVLGFDQFGFAVFRRHCDKWKQEHRSHEYSYPSVSASKLESWQKMLNNWNEAGASCMDKMHIFLEDGVPIKVRGRLWKCLLGSDLVKESTTHTYQEYVQELRSQLASLGVTEYGVQVAISTLDNADRERAETDSTAPNLMPNRNPEITIETLRQIVLDVERSFPTHCSLMGKNPEAKEGQAKLFRILSAYAKYNPQIGYCQVLALFKKYSTGRRVL
ncbi:TBC1 domain family member whacked-like [Rhincodon typus]|uniref:TBC1 domain family member whacked-like n=1 Tax=Rhincodon typus TaxID=259920 RepID=UPI0020307883|nr:TBC1 domain family member whacked-like [Rhincodon typus]